MSGEPPERRLTYSLWLLAPVVLATVVVTAVLQPLTRSRLALSSADLIDQFPLWSWLADLPWPVPEGTGLALTLLLAGAAGFGAYGLAVIACWRRASTRGALAAVLLPATGFLVVSALALPTQSSDMVDYLLSGRVAAVHGASPYDVAPAAFPEDPLLPYASGTYTVDAEEKPALWIAAAVGLAAVAGDDPAVAVLVLRLALLGVTLLNLGLIAAVLHRWRPEHLLAGLVLYGWNPVVALHGQAKLDTLMATFALLSVLALVTSRRLAVVPLLWMSVLVKVLTLPLLAAYVLSEVAARRWGRLAGGVLALIAVTVLAYAPFGGRLSLVVEHLGLAERGGSSLPGVAGLLVIALVVGLVAHTGLRSRDDPERLLQGWALVSLGLVLLTPIGWAWYLITPLALISLSGKARLTAAAVALSGLAFTTDMWTRSYGEGSTLPDVGLSRSSAYVLALLVAVGGAALLRAAGSSRRRRPTPGAAPLPEES